MKHSTPLVTASPLDPALQPRILMLVPCEPHKDPHVLASIDICAEVAWTEVAAFCHNIYHQQSRRYDGRVYQDLVNYTPYFGPQYGPPSGERFPFDEGFVGADASLSDEIARVLAMSSDVVETLYFRGRTVSVAPRVLVCHGPEALLAGVRLKRRFGFRLVYDAPVPWPVAHPQASPEARGWIEGKLLVHADHVVTSTPFTADLFERTYGLKDAVPVLDAAPMEYRGPRSFERPRHTRRRFLLQGDVTPYDEGTLRSLVEQWCQLNYKPAVLVLRAPQSELLTELTARYAGPIERGLLSIEPASAASSAASLVETASCADVSVLAFGAPRVDYTLGCPRLLSIAMQAGTAIMYCQDQRFTADVVDRYQCGRAYELINNGLSDAVRFFSESDERLDQLKVRAWEGARDWLHHELQKRPYVEALQNSLKQQDAAIR